MKFFNLSMPDQVFGMDSNLLVVYVQPFLLLVVILMSIGGIVMPRIDEMETMKTQSISFTKKTKDLREKISYLTQVDQSEIKSQADFLRSSLMNGRDSYYLVNIIRKLAEKFGFMVESFLITPGTVSEVGIDSKLPIKVVIIGPKEKYLGLLLAIEKNLPILSIDTFSIRSSGGSTELTLGMSSYYLSEKTVEKSANISLSDLVMKEDEADVLKRLSDFVPIDNVPVAEIELGEIGAQKPFVKYERENPFTP